MAGTKWLLIEVFGGKVERPFSVIGLGRAQKPFVPLETIVRHRATLREATRAIADVTASRQAVDQISADGIRRTVAMPLMVDPIRLHGVMLWSGPPSEPIPPRDRAGAWYFDLPRNISIRSDDLLDLYGIPPGSPDRIRQHSLPSMFAQITANNRNQGDALAKIVRSAPGEENQSVWTIPSPDGDRAGQFSCRLVEERDSHGQLVVFVRGITHDVGPATETPAAPPPTILEHRVLELSAEDGEYRALMDMRSGHLMRWVGPPPPGVAWQALEGEPTPAIHPEDFPIAREMFEGLRDKNRTTGRFRLRALDGGWIVMQARAALVMLDESTNASLVTLRVAE